jgi:hypothetical protein
MEPFTLKWIEIQEKLSGGAPEFPKYTTQLMNLANQNAQGTRPRVVGQMSELIKEFSGTSYSQWVDWYASTHPLGIEDATNRVLDMVDKLRDAFLKIDRTMVKDWISDLVLNKTFVGFRFQDAILLELAARLGKEMRRALPEDESRGIDGFIGGDPVSVKPTTYRTMPALAEGIDVPIVFYEKKKSGIYIDPMQI